MVDRRCGPRSPGRAPRNRWQPHVEVIGLSKEKVEQALRDTVVEIRERLEGIKLSHPQRP